jgi:hypothetical protein
MQLSPLSGGWSGRALTNCYDGVMAVDGYEDDAGPAVTVGLVASPGPASELAERLLPDLADRLTEHMPEVRWRVKLISDRLVDPPTELADLISAGRRRLLTEGWDLAVCVTDLPLQTARRPIIAHASATHGVAVVSMPALGAVGVRGRAAETIVRLVVALLGHRDQVGPGNASGSVPPYPLPVGVTRRLKELGGRVELDESGLELIARVITGNLRLLLGMLRANRPWRLAMRLSRALTAAVAAGVFALVTSDIWRLADGLGWVRLTLIAAGSILGTTLTIIVSANLWERHPRSGAREQVVLFNVVTATTVTIGVVSLYVALLILTFLAALLLIPDGVLAEALGHPVGLSDQIELAWLASSIATIGDALGAGLENDEAVREAAYTYQSDRQLSAGT